MMIDEVVPVCSRTGENHLAVILPTREKIQSAIKLRDEYRSIVGLPTTGIGYQPPAFPMHADSYQCSTSSSGVSESQSINDIGCSDLEAN